MSRESNDARPTSAACAGCGAAAVDRRTFVAQSALAALGLAVSACGDGEIGGPLGGGDTGLPNAIVVNLADYPELGTVGGTARVDANTNRPVAVTRTGPNAFVALSMICPHAGYKPILIMAPGFVCPNHGAQFESNGNWVGGQRTRDLTPYSVVYNAGAGTLTIS